MKATTVIIIKAQQLHEARAFLDIYFEKYPNQEYFNGSIRDIAIWLRQPQWKNNGYPQEVILGFFHDFAQQLKITQVNF
jgi:hypothetical protein